MKLNFITEDSKGDIIQFNNSIKATLTKQHNIFEGLNIRYFGPIDGHDVDALVRILDEIKNFEGPKVIHCITKKGKGYEPAEKSVTEWHAPGKFDVETGERNTSSSQVASAPLYQDVFGETLLELAKTNPKIVAITPAMPSGCSMTIMQKEFPERVFDVGIAEAHAVTFSAGMAKDGMTPFCNIYSSFMQRAYDNVIQDVAIQNLNVVFCLDRAGIVGADGATHHGIFDIPYMRCIPNLTVTAPRNEMELRNLMYTAQQPNMGPFVIRYPRGKGHTIDWKQKLQALPIGKGEKLKNGNDLAIISIGTMAYHANQAIIKAEKELNITVAHYDMRFVKPIDEELLHEIAKKYTFIITIEDGVIDGGFGSRVLEFMSDHHYTPSIKRLGINDAFIEHGTPEELFHLINLDEEGIFNEIAKFLPIPVINTSLTL